MLFRPLPVLLAVLLAGTAFAADPTPEVRRGAYPAQAIGQPHTIRIIPEACVYLQGEFTNVPDAPYRWFSARSSDRCQPRATYVDANRAKPAVERGWRLNDVIRVPNQSCPGQQAVIRVWRQPMDNAPPPADAQGRPRIYLEDAKRQAAQGKTPPVSRYSATMSVEGKSCTSESD